MAVEEALDRLPEQQAQAIRLRMEGYEVAEIAELAGPLEAVGGAAPSGEPGAARPAARRLSDGRANDRGERHTTRTDADVDADVRARRRARSGGRGRRELDGYVRAFELAYARRGGADPAAFLPPADHPLHAAVLRELVRVDLEFGWERGRPKDLAEYRAPSPRSGRPRGAPRDRLRGVSAPPASRARPHARRVPEPLRGPARPGRQPAPAARPGGGAATGPGCRNGTDRLPAARDGSGAAGPAAIPSLPDVGDEFLGFRLIGELGRGSFGRVYLARQAGLADRPVVLKVTADVVDESQTLAQLQHDNIVPVYSVHRVGRLRAVCMPYLGSVTLRDVVDDLKATGACPTRGEGC